jgi:hypothetical protein
MKTHIRDIRLFNNAGISMPVCYAIQSPLDLDKTGLPISQRPEQATCKHCQRVYPKRYPWAVRT